MSKKVMYRVVRGAHTRTENGRRVRYEKGGIFAPTKKELEAFGNKFEPVLVEQPKNNPGKPNDGKGKGDKEKNKTQNPGRNDVKAPEEPIPMGGGWWKLPNGDSVRGKEKALEEWEKVKAGNSS